MAEEDEEREELDVASVVLQLQQITCKLESDTCELDELRGAYGYTQRVVEENDELREQLKCMEAANHWL